MTLHVLGLPHSAVSSDFSWCAYTTQIRNFRRMFPESILYANEGSEGDFIPILGADEIQQPSWDPPAWNEWNRRAIVAIQNQIQPRDLILTWAGRCQEPVASAFPQAVTVEAGIGYDVGGTFARFRVYVSTTHREWCLGAQNQRGEDTDSIAIPCSFDLSEFRETNQPRVDEALAGIFRGGYLVHIGRPNWDKGADVARMVAEHFDLPLVLVGVGHEPRSPLEIAFGLASPLERAAILAEAACLLAPTRYREPFGMVAVEAQLMGVPAITTDAGAFQETVERPWRCSSLRDFLVATQKALMGDFDPVQLQESAASRFGLEAVKPLYEGFFQRIADRWDAGWFAR